MRLLGALVLLVHWSGVESEGTPCPVSLSILVPDGEAESRSDGSLVHAGRVYPAGSHWRDLSGTRVCPCSLERPGRACLRQCCGDGRIIAEVVEEPEYQCELHEKARDELLIPQERASPEMQAQLAARPGLRDWFSLVKSPECPEHMKAWRLDPLQHDEAYVLYPNGSLWAPTMEEATKLPIVPSERFCLDLGRRSDNQSDELAAIVCVVPQPPSEETPTAIWIGYLLSVPFLAVTFIVYAIIPELRNIYGKTLMCYVLSLLIAYASFLIAHSLVVPFCGYTDIRSTLEKDFSCSKNENFKACAPSCERICNDINNDNHAGEHCTTAATCESKCICQDGYVRENFNGKCIRVQECPRVKH